MANAAGILTRPIAAAINYEVTLIARSFSAHLSIWASSEHAAAWELTGD